MTTPMTDFRITLNKPAEKAYFEGENAKGIQTKIEDDSIQFRATEDLKGDDVAVISPRGRGGLEAVFEGSGANAAFDVLAKAATPARPFFLLHRSGKGGWFGIRHYDSDGAPPKFEPHLRLWWSRAAETSPRPEPIATPDASDYESRIRAAAKMVEDHRESRRIGRPPREVAEAMALLEGFENLASKINPIAPAMNITSVMAAFEVVSKFMREIASKTEAESTAAPETDVALAAPVAESSKRIGRPKGSKNKASAKRQEAVSAAEPPARRGGRPKGSKNKPKDMAAGRRMGRPKGSKNRPKAVEAASEPDVRATVTQKRGGGRPKGSKNKATATKSSIFVRAPRRRRVLQAA